MAPADLDGDHITDYVYAGDLLGNLWRFDLTGGTETDLGRDRGRSNVYGAGRQPISTEPLVGSPHRRPARRA